MHLHPEKTDEEVVAMSLRQREFFGILIERYQDKLARYVRRLGVRSEDDVADVLQETFIKVYRNLNEFDSSFSFSSWVYRIAHNETMSWHRKRSVRPEGYLIDDGDAVLSLLTSDDDSDEERFDAGIDAERLSKAVASLDAKYRDVVILRFFEHKEYDEISDILKIPIGSVGTQIHRAKKQLRTLLDTELH